MDPAAIYHMPLYKTGAAVRWGRRQETVSHVALSRRGLMVYLVGHEVPVCPDELQLAPTAFRLARTAETA
jgi:hypothetical protein